MSDLKGKTLFITGASRGIGKAIAIRAARDGANIVIAAKTAKPHPKLPGTIYTAAEEIEAEGESRRCGTGSACAPAGRPVAGAERWIQRTGFVCSKTRSSGWGEATSSWPCRESMSSPD